jgi:DtxR family Mn-dependent transcriptional regulator
MTEMNQPLLALGIAAACGALLALVFWPERGLLARWRRAQRMSEHVYREDALKHIHSAEMAGRRPTLQSIAGALQIGLDEAAALVGRMESDGLLIHEQDTPRLTPEGRLAAAHIIRAHRLWERYLAEETGYAEPDWHSQAEAREHDLSPDEVERLAARLGNPLYDPHGDPIPLPDGQVARTIGEPLAAVPPSQPARIVHLEDEPEAIYAQLVAEGLYPGLVVRVIDATPERVRFWANGDEHVLAPVLAGNITVRRLAAQDAALPNGSRSLNELALGESAQVVTLAPGLRGQERRRLLDLGLLPGTKVTAEVRSPSGDPTGYRIRGATVALRAEQASLIKVRPVTVEEARHE